MKRLILSFATLAMAGTGLAASHQDRNSPGHDSAYGICDAMYYQADKLACYDLVDSIQYLSLEPVQLCSTLYYTADKKTCLSTVAEKIYSDRHLKLCKDMYYTADKLSCLAKYGDIVDDQGNEPGHDGVLVQLETIDIMTRTARRAKEQLRRGQYADAQRSVESLIHELQTIRDNAGNDGNLDGTIVIGR